MAKHEPIKIAGDFKISFIPITGGERSQLIQNVEESWGAEMPFFVVKGGLIVQDGDLKRWKKEVKFAIEEFAE